MTDGYGYGGGVRPPTGREPESDLGLGVTEPLRSGSRTALEVAKGRRQLKDPSIRIKDIVFTDGASFSTADVTLELDDPGGAPSGTLEVWVNKGSTNPAVLTSTPEGTVSIADGDIPPTTVFTLVPGPGTDLLLGDIRVPQGSGQAKRIYARWTAGQNNRTTGVVVLELVRLPSALGPGGQLRRAQQFDDGEYALRADENTGQTATNDVKESGGKEIRRLLAKALAADADSLDGVPEGTIYKRLAEFARLQLLRRGSHAGFLSGNLVFNPGFEDGTAFWSAGNGLTVPTSSATAFEGNRYAEIIGVNSVERFSFQIDDTGFSRQVPCRAGNTVRLAFRGWREAIGTSANVIVSFNDRDGNQLNAIAVGPSSTGAWELVTSEMVAPTGTQSIHWYLSTGVSASSGGLAARWDNITVKVLDVAAEIEAGTFRSGMLESGGKALNRLLAKVLAGDADSFDGVPAGTYMLWTGLRASALIADASAYATARQGHGVFFETYEVDLSSAVWAQVTGDLTTGVTYPSNGQAGGRVVKVSALQKWWRLQLAHKIPFDPSKLYRMRARVRRTADGGAGTKQFYCGVAGVDAAGALNNFQGNVEDSSQHYICAAGANQELWTVNEWQEFTGWFKGWAATGDTTPSTDPRNPRRLHQDTRYFCPLTIVNYDGTGQMDDVEIDYLAIDVFDEEGQARLYGALEAEQLLRQGVLANDAGSAKGIGKGVVVGQCSDGVPVTFPTTYQNVPKVIVIGGISYEPRSGQWSPSFSSTTQQAADTAAENLSASGFTPRGKLRQPGTPTTRTHQFAGTQLDTPGETDSLTTANAPAANNIYTVRAKGELHIRQKTATAATITLQFALDSSFDAGANWSERQTFVRALTGEGAGIQTDDTFDEDVVLSITGMDTDSIFRWRCISVVISGGGTLSQTEAWVRGCNNGSVPGHGCEYATSSDNVATKTSQANEKMYYFVVGQ